MPIIHCNLLWEIHNQCHLAKKQSVLFKSALDKVEKGSIQGDKGADHVRPYLDSLPLSLVTNKSHSSKHWTQEFRSSSPFQ